MENINMGIVSTVSKNIDFASFKIEEINKEIKNIINCKVALFYWILYNNSVSYRATIEI